MADWLSSMTQTYEFYKVDPGTWMDESRITSIISARISRDLESQTLETASINTTEIFGECYIRIYMITDQNGVKEKHPLGTFLVQTPSTSFDGKVKNITIDAYSPLLELNDVKPPIGYTIMRRENIMEHAYRLTKENLRAPVVEVTGITEKTYTDFTAESDESWLNYLTALLQTADYNYSLDEMGRVLFSPRQDTESLQPVWTYTDDDSSILYADVTDNFDLYAIPNTVEVVYSGQDESGLPLKLYSKVVNNEKNSPISVKSRGRTVLHRELNPTLNGIPSQEYLDDYAERLLKDLSSIQHTISYSHGYCPVRIGDCVRLNYERAGLKDIKARVISQDIDCSSGCKVTETAVYTTNLWKEG